MSDQTTNSTPADETVEVPAEESAAAPTEVVAEEAAPTSTESEPESRPDEVVAAPGEPAAAPDEPVADATEPEPEPAPVADATEPAPEPAPVADAPATPTPRPAVPSPAAMASRMAARPAPPVVAPIHQHSESARFGRVDDEGHVFVTVGDEEREVGSYPGAEPDDALQYFARKYDELAGSADLLQQRLGSAEVPAKEIADALATLKVHVAEAKVVGDLAALDSTVAAIESGLATKRETEQAARAEARAAAAVEREAIVAEAEAIAGQHPDQIQWKQSGERMRALLDQWKGHQRSGTKLDKPTETSLWQRFSHARNHFDKGRRTYFAQLDSTRAEARSAKESLVREAEALSTSKDWSPTARAFKNLMDQWKQVGRASRAEDDALWERFKAAQDAFFNAKDEVSAVEEEEFRANLAVKEALMVEAEKILPVTDLESAKSQLRIIQDKWDAAGKVPRADIERTEKVIRRVETAVREVDDKKWKSSNPEVAARANSMVTQLRSSIETIEADLAKATAAGNDKKVKDLTARLESQQVWLKQAEAANDEFGA